MVVPENDRQKRLSSLALAISGAASFGIMAVLVVCWALSTAQTAVAVHPWLRYVGITTAAKNGQAANWLFYHYPFVAYVVAVMLSIMPAGGVAGLASQLSIIALQKRNSTNE